MDVPTLDRLLLHGFLEDLMSQVPQVSLQKHEMLEPVAGQGAPLGPEDVATSAEHPLHGGRAKEGVFSNAKCRLHFSNKVEVSGLKTGLPTLLTPDFRHLTPTPRSTSDSVGSSDTGVGTPSYDK